MSNLPQARYSLGFHGPSITTHIQLTPKALLEVITMKRSDKRLSTTVKLQGIQGDFLVHSYGDYSVMPFAERLSRVTRAAMEAQHAATMAKVDEYKAAALKWLDGQSARKAELS